MRGLILLVKSLSTSWQTSLIVVRIQQQMYVLSGVGVEKGNEKVMMKVLDHGQPKFLCEQGRKRKLRKNDSHTPSQHKGHITATQKKLFFW